MKCPNNDGELQEIDLNGVKADICLRCNGTWFDNDELRVAKDSADQDLRWLDFDLFKNENGKFVQTAEIRKCPKCATETQALEYATSKVIIDACPKGHGEWLDAKEFDNIIEFLNNLTITMPSSEYTKSTIEELKEIVTGDESTVSEVKDFLAVFRLYQYRLAAENPEATKKINGIATYFRI